MNMKFQLLLKTKVLKNKDLFFPAAHSCNYHAHNVKMVVICGHDKFHARLS